METTLWNTRHAAAVAKYGPSIDARVMQFEEARASVEDSPLSRRISMLVIPYERLSDPFGGIREVYERGSFKEGLDEDPFCSWGHDQKYVLGRRSSGTARFLEDGAGVHCDVDAPDTTWASDLLVSVRRGDFSSSSAAFFILKHRFDSQAGERIRVIERGLLVEASVVARPQYPSATASVHRSAEQDDWKAKLEIQKMRLEILRLR